jgi:hypothetical protein
MTIPAELIALLVTALGTGCMGLLTIVAHQMIRVSTALAAINARNGIEDERHNNLAKDVTDIQARLDRKGVLA